MDVVVSWLNRRTTARRVIVVVLVIYLVLLAIALLAPTNTDQSSMVMWLIHQLLHTGASTHVVTFSRMEFVMNVAIFVPAAFLAALLWPRWNWRDWTAVGFVVSGCVELTQALLLPHRDGSFSDVVSNTLGALIGALIADGVLLIMRRRRAPKP
jgi:glycopeptide antibiotics resistance protein